MRASFNDGEKIARKFTSAHAKRDSWRELLLGENYSPTSSACGLCVLNVRPVVICVASDMTTDHRGSSRILYPSTTLKHVVVFLE